MNQKNIENWKDMGYGMFIHFGLFSLCGGKWKNKKVEKGYSEQIIAENVIPQLDYYALADKFEIPDFSAKEIVSLAKNSGMKYITLVTKHHDGFCLFDTTTTTFSSMNTPYHKDIVNELAKECREQGIKLGLYFSWIDWHYPLATPMSNTNSDIITDEHQKYNLAQLTELLSNYGEIVELWMDMGKPTLQQSKEVYDLAHSLQPNIMINSRIWNNYGDFLTMGDNDYPEVDLDLPWQVPATIFKETWGYRSWQKRENIEDKIKDLTKSITSVLDLGGNFLLNIGPNDTGAIVKYEKEVLLGIGEKLKQRENFRIPKPKLIKMFKIEDLDNVEPTKHYNYCGNEYYSNKPELIGLSWRIKVDPNKKYSLGWTNKEPLKKDLKLKLSIGNNIYYINLINNFKTSVLSDNITTDKDYIDISLFTIGENLRIPKFEESGIKITLKNN